MLSIIIPAHDEELVLPATLSALRIAAAALPVPTEIIVADDSSTDRTAAVALEHGATVVSINVRQIAAARNAGARAARGDLLFFVDADTIVPPATALAALRALTGGAVAGGCQVDFDNPIPPYAHVLLPAFQALARALRFAPGCFLFCTREAFDAAGGFDESLFASEEVALSLALKREGRFAFLREGVVTSGRKLRTHTARELFLPLLPAAFGRLHILRRREGLDMWYGPRRPDPGAPGPAPADPPS